MKKSSKTFSPEAVRLYRLLDERGGRFTLDQMLRDLQFRSKTKLNSALAELEDAGIISLE